MRRLETSALAVVALTAAWGCLSGCGPRQTPDQPAAPAPAPAHDRELAAALELVDGDDPAAAIDALAAAVTRFPSNATAWANLGRVHWRSGNRSQAMAALENASLLAPDDPRPLEFAARIAGDTGDWERARMLLDQANRRLSYSPRILSAMGVVEAHLGEHELAVAYFEEAIDADPRYAAALYNLGILYRDHLNQPEQAEPLLRRYLAIADDPERVAAVHAQLQPAPPPAPSPTPAPDATATELAPTPAPTPAPDATATELARAREAVNRGAMDTAIVTLKAIVEKHPHHADALWELGRIYEQLGVTARADVYYARFREAAPNDPRAARRDTPSPAPTPTPTPAPAPQPTPDAGALWRDALAAQKRGDATRAIAGYEAALRIDDELFVAWYNVGLLYKDTGRLNEAAKALKRAAALRPDYLDATFMQAVVAYEQGKHDATLATLDPLLSKHPDHARGHYLAGLANAKLRRRGTARVHFEQVVLLDEGSTHGRSAKEWLTKNARRTPPSPRR